MIPKSTAALVAGMSLFAASVGVASSQGGTGCTILGTDGNDVIVGTGQSDYICALGGDDVVRGRGGNDLIVGGAGAG